MTLGERIKARRVELGLTQAQLAEKAGVRQPTLSIWESDSGSPQLAKLTSVAAALGVSVADLVAADALADTLPPGAA
jgi:transcriptional regulator with XRE-family HTH domain